MLNIQMTILKERNEGIRNKKEEQLDKNVTHVTLGAFVFIYQQKFREKKSGN